MLNATSMAQILQMLIVETVNARQVIKEKNVANVIRVIMTSMMELMSLSYVQVKWSYLMNA